MNNNNNKDNQQTISTQEKTCSEELSHENENLDSQIGIIMNDFLSSSHEVAMEFFQKLQNGEELATEIRFRLQELMNESREERRKLIEIQQVTSQNCAHLSESLQNLQAKYEHASNYS